MGEGGVLRRVGNQVASGAINKARGTGAPLTQVKSGVVSRRRAMPAQPGKRILGPGSCAAIFILPHKAG